MKCHRVVGGRGGSRDSGGGGVKVGGGLRDTWGGSGGPRGITGYWGGHTLEGPGGSWDTGGRPWGMMGRWGS